VIELSKLNGVDGKQSRIIVTVFPAVLGKGIDIAIVIHHDKLDKVTDVIAFYPGGIRTRHGTGGTVFTDKDVDSKSIGNGVSRFRGDGRNGVKTSCQQKGGQDTGQQAAIQLAAFNEKIILFWIFHTKLLKLFSCKRIF
jgi:hypothetical protein